jgi:hypothetical protein
LCEYGDVFERNTVGFGNVADERVDVFDEIGETRVGLLGILGVAVAARVPGEHGEAGQVQLVDDVLQTARVFMSAMEENDRLGRGCLSGGPVAVEQTGSRCGIEVTFFGGAH